MHIGKKIKMVRQLKGLTQQQLADKINKTRALVGHIEQTGKVNHYTLVLITKILGASIEDLDNFNGKPNIFAEPSTPYGKSDLEKLKQQLENYRKENEMLQELVQSQKRVIAMLEKKKGK